jgi:Kef-type K+ transport system membrane component KefB
MKLTKTLKRVSVWALVVAAVLMIPYLGKFPWTTGDFVFAGAVLFSAATTYEVITSQLKNRNHRIAVGLAVAMVVILIWGWAVGGP